MEIDDNGHGHCVPWACALATPVTVTIARVTPLPDTVLVFKKTYKI